MIPHINSFKDPRKSDYLSIMDFPTVGWKTNKRIILDGTVVSFCLLRATRYGWIVFDNVFTVKWSFYAQPAGCRIQFDEWSFLPKIVSPLGNIFMIFPNPYVSEWSWQEETIPNGYIDASSICSPPNNIRYLLSSPNTIQRYSYIIGKDLSSNILDRSLFGCLLNSLMIIYQISLLQTHDRILPNEYDNLFIFHKLI